MAHIAGMTIMREMEDGSVIVKFSPAAIAALEQIAAIAAPTIKARLAARELKRGERALEKLNATMGEVKAAQMKELRDPYLQWLEAARSGPLNWQ